MSWNDIVLRSDALAELGNRINVAHDAAAAALTSGVESARLAGELLAEAKKQCPHGRWLKWLETNCPRVGARQAQKYMRLASKWAELNLANANPDSHSTIDRALAVLADRPEPDPVEQPAGTPGAWLPGDVTGWLSAGRGVAAHPGDGSPEGPIGLVQLTPSARHPGYAFARVVVNVEDGAGEELVTKHPVSLDGLGDTFECVARRDQFLRLSWRSTDEAAVDDNPWLDLTGDAEPARRDGPSAD